VRRAEMAAGGIYFLSGKAKDNGEEYFESPFVVTMIAR
jgi:hypothetical protein